MVFLNIETQLGAGISPAKLAPLSVLEIHFIMIFFGFVL